MIERIRRYIRELKYAYQVSRLSPRCPFPPQFIYIEPTNACVLNCKMCMRSKTKIRKLGYMDFDLYKKIIDDISSRAHNIGLLNQGEPLLHPKFVDMIQYAKQKGLKVGFSTNAVLLDETKARKILETKLDWIYFSFDGPNKQIYEEIRRGANYEKVKQNILRFIELRDKKKKKKPVIYMYIIEMSDTKDYIDEFLRYWKEKVDYVGTNKLINFFDLVDDEELDWYKAIRSRNYPWTSYPICVFPWFIMTVNWDGTVEYCLADFTGHNIVGDARKENVLDIWNNAESIEFRRAALQRDFSKLRCATCSSLWTSKDQVPPSFKGYLFSKLVLFKGQIKKEGRNPRWQEHLWGKHFEWDPSRRKWKFKNLRSLIFE